MKRSLLKYLSYTSPLFNTRAAGLYLILFAIAIGVATFIENDFGSSAAQKVVYKAGWFELLLILFGITIVVNIFKFRMIQQKKWALLMFHAAILIILLGSGITRYFGFEGMMHIREAETSNTFLSSDTYLNFEVYKDGETYSFDEPVLFASLGNNDWHESYLIDGSLIDVRIKDFLPNPKPVLYESESGSPILKIVVAGMNGREEYFLKKGEIKKIKNVIYDFKDGTTSDAIRIRFRHDSLQFTTPRPLTQMVMATQERDTIYPSNNFQPLTLRSLYSDGVNNFVFAEFLPKGEVAIKSESSKVKNESMVALLAEVSVDGQSQQAYIYGNRGLEGRPAIMNFGGLSMSVSYGAKVLELPFALQLKKFILEKYPGTNSASSYASEVVLIDPQKQLREDHRIYMNHILNYGGYRFFQSSFDRDEQGTYLSVNHDFWGSLVSYIGYGLLTLGMLWTFMSKKTRFYQLTQRVQRIRSKQGVVLCVLLLLTNWSMAKTQAGPVYAENAVSKVHASRFSTLVVQDFRGRMKPVHTLSREIMRKLSRKESRFGLNADQILLSLFANSQEWYAAPLIKMGKHQDLKKLLGVNGAYAAYRDFFHQNGTYKLKEEVRRVYGLDPIDRGVYEKEILKIDERVNILGMALSGALLKVIPNPEDPDHHWLSADTHTHRGSSAQNRAEKFFAAYRSALRTAIASGQYGQADQLLEELRDYQLKNGGSIMPTPVKVRAEILLNQLDVFSRLMPWYLVLGMTFLFLLFYSVFRPEARLQRLHLGLLALVGLGFFMHTTGLAIRWYVSGRAPWSNGYESMIYIAWTTTLAGIIFTRKSLGGMAATMVLAATILFVASLSFLDPEITPLVPVLKSYWLTIHVSMEAGSYGFLMLGAIIGLINLMLMMFLRESNKENLKRIIQEMSYISELTITGGLFMVSIGTYLGGVWANESWGRYWGWDAKETWALVTILVYAFILHIRLIPKMFGLYAYNLATIFGMASVIMTYFGVNYYLSGLHSYAAGDPVPIPTWVYYAVAGVFLISGLAYFNKRKYPIIK
ncbi:MAG: cytochrome C biogenesis protein [Bacteroidetes bacterium]|nr:MAG: cytochrome C biogenesis protein [Bacteroidota bacterium]